MVLLSRHKNKKSHRDTKPTTRLKAKGLFVVSVFAMLFTLVPADIVQAAAPTTPTDRARVFGVGNALSECIAKANQPRQGWASFDRDLSETDVRNGTWFSTASVEIPLVKGAPSFLVSGLQENGEKQCNDVLQDALGLLGVSAFDLFCEIKPERPSGASCKSGAEGDFGTLKTREYADAFERFAGTIWGSGWQKIPLSDYYVLHYEAFIKGCSAKKNPTASEDFRYVIDLVDPSTGVIQKNTVYEGRSKGTKRFAYTSEGLNKQEKTCEQIAAAINTYAEPYSLAVRSLASTGGDTAVLEGVPGAESEEGATSCAIDGIGWIICPAISFIGRLNDMAFELLSDTFLEVEASLIQDDNGATFEAWKNFRDIANVLFVIAFVVIVYGQMVGGRD